MNTLLEPNNNNSASQNDAEEIREVSIQLNGIKKKHDEAKKLVNAKKEEFDRTRKDIDQLSQQE
jgi:chromosome segregation ATPase